jgi:hypothetical protein
VLEKPAKLLLAQDSRQRNCPERLFGRRSGGEWLIIQSLMRPPPVVPINVTLNYVPQMLLAENHEMIQGFDPNILHKANVKDMR